MPWELNNLFPGPKPFTDVSIYATLQAGVTAAAGGVAYFPPGFNPTLTSSITVSANTILRFDGNTLTAGATLATGFFNIGASDIRVEGSYVMAGAGFAADGFQGNAATIRFSHQAQGRFDGGTNNSNLINIVGGSNIVIGGLLLSTSCTVVRLFGCTTQEVSGVQAGPYTRALAASTAVIHIRDNGTAAPPNDVDVHDCSIDGNGNLVYGALVVAQSVGGGTHGAWVRISNVLVKNGGAGAQGSGDCIDVVQMDQVGLYNCHVYGGNNGIDVAGCNFVAGYGGSAQFCKSAGLQIGDLTVAFATSFVTANGFIAIDCGIGGQVDFTAAGIVVFAPAAASTNSVILNNCQSYKNAQANMKYGFGIGNGAGGTFSFGVEVNGGFYSGATAAFLDSSTGGPTAVYHDVANINPRGTAIVTPGFPATTVASGKTPGVDVLAVVINGASAMTNVSINGQTVSTSLPASAVATFVIPALGTMTFTYPGGAPSWIWYGL